MELKVIRNDERYKEYKTKSCSRCLQELVRSKIAYFKCDISSPPLEFFLRFMDLPIKSSNAV